MKAKLALLMVLISLPVAACSAALPTPAQPEPAEGTTIPAVEDAAPHPVALPGNPAALSFPTAGFIASEILGRPTGHSITVNVVPGEDVEVLFEYGVATDGFHAATPQLMCYAGEPVEVVIDGLSPDTDYIYRVRFRRPGEDAFSAGPTHQFHTWRPQGAAFTFDVQADTHLDEGVIPELYRQALQNILADEPDFLIDLGDTFMSTKTAADENDVVARHLLQRDYFGSTCHSVPLYLVLGNHEGELGWLLDGTADNMAVWATQARQRYYVNPLPDGFYSGDTTQYEFVGLRESCYAWEWGDALFIALDPYWLTTSKPKVPEESWNWTLGKDQYDWLAAELRASTARFKFVLIHHLTGGAESVARGGIEAAPYFEWGGLNADGTAGFAEHRPGWEMPIHDLLVETGVSAVFHGHDHFFGYQQLDGIVYQEVPQPGHPANEKQSPGAAYGYVQGTLLSSPGHLRVNVSPEQVQVEYIRATLPGDASGTVSNGEVVFSYVISSHAL